MHPSEEPKDVIPATTVSPSAFRNKGPPLSPWEHNSGSITLIFTLFLIPCMGSTFVFYYTIYCNKILNIVISSMLEVYKRIQHRIKTNSIITKTKTLFEIFNILKIPKCKENKIFWVNNFVGMFKKMFPSGLYFYF